MSRLRTFGWNAGKLSELTFDELNQLREAITSDPANANPDHAKGRSIYLYTRSARRKLDALGWAVTYRLQAKRTADDPETIR